MAASEEGDGLYFVVNNIPVTFRSADLRNYFSQFIESGGFLCFHYRHRPEVRINTAEAEKTQRETEEVEEGEEDDEEKKKKKKESEGKAEGVCCCVVCVKRGDAERFVKMYSGNQWIDSRGNWLVKRCRIRRIKVSDHSDPDAFPYKTKAELRRPGSHTERFTKADLHALPELTPPALMPAGNVGTPVGVFLQLIQSCRFPPRLIRKLGLTFPKTGSHRRYGNVPYHYNTPVVAASEDSVFTAGGVEICGPGGVAPGKSTEEPRDGTRESEERPIREESEEEGEESGPDDDDDRCEEWERHEALHDDVTSQERSKERLYEEEIELKWEKGGSGLVFYTDAQYWQEEEGGQSPPINICSHICRENFDEQTADDWDVDMSVYYDKDGGDMDSRDYVSMRYEKRLRDGVEQPGSSQQKIGKFEKFTKGVGRRVMEKQGWKDGEGLGHSRSGIPEALENEGQHPNCKRGFGYHGEKLSSFLPLKKPRPEFLISTVYDEPRDIDRGDTVLRRQPSTSMKHTHRRPEESQSRPFISL